MADNLIVTVQETSNTFATTNVSNPSYVETMDNIGDVDMSTNGKVEGSVLVYKESTQKWTSTTTLDAQDVTGGQY